VTDLIQIRSNDGLYFLRCQTACYDGITRWHFDIGATCSAFTFTEAFTDPCATQTTSTAFTGSVSTESTEVVCGSTSPCNAQSFTGSRSTEAKSFRSRSRTTTGTTGGIFKVCFNRAGSDLTQNFTGTQTEFSKVHARGFIRSTTFSASKIILLITFALPACIRTQLVATLRTT
jgi:hypothetical protein